MTHSALTFFEEKHACQSLAATKDHSVAANARRGCSQNPSRWKDEVDCGSRVVDDCNR